MLATLQKWGNSQGVRIPKSLIDSLHWNNDEKLSIVADNNKIIIEPVQKRKNITELFEGYDEVYTPEKIDWGQPVGKEIW